MRTRPQVNGIPVRKLGIGMAGDAPYAEYFVPEETVNRYRGWLRLEFDPGSDAPDKKPGNMPVVFQRITATPSAQP